MTIVLIPLKDLYMESTIELGGEGKLAFIAGKEYPITAAYPEDTKMRYEVTSEYGSAHGVGHWLEFFDVKIKL